MSTLFSIVLAGSSFLWAGIPTALVCLVAGFASAPGNLIFEAAKRNKSGFMLTVGIILALVGMLYIHGAWIVILVSLIRWAAVAGAVTWPLWIAGWFLAGFPAVMMTKENAAEPTGAHLAAAFAPFGVLALLVIACAVPRWIYPAYSWLPLADYLIPR